MLPSHPPSVTHGDFDPSTYPINEEREEMDIDDDEESTVDLSSTEINILIYLVRIDILAFPSFAYSNRTHTPPLRVFEVCEVWS